MTKFRRRRVASVSATVILLLLPRSVCGFAPASITTVTRNANPSKPEARGALPLPPKPEACAFRIPTELFVGTSLGPENDVSSSDLSSNNKSSLQEDDTNPNDDSASSLSPTPTQNDESSNPLTSSFSPLWSMLTGGGPPLQVDDTELLLYDAFLILNLSASISFWVVHRMNFNFIASSVNEGALLTICWIIAGLANGAFLFSAVDGHYDPLGEDAEKGGPKAAGLLGLSTMVGTSSLRILVALILAVVQHRPVGSGGEELIPLEILVGLVLMSSWRALHSYYTPRI